MVQKTPTKFSEGRKIEGDFFVKVSLFGCKIDNLTIDETIDQVKKIITSRQPVQHVVMNASKVNLMLTDVKLRDIINSSPLVNADGMSVVWASKILGKPLKERVTGIDLFYKLLNESETHGYRVYFLGATESIVNEVVTKAKKTHENLNVAGYHHGYFDKNNCETVINKISQSNADILFVAFSSPMKEYWINENLHKINVPFTMGVGGTFDVYAGKTSRAPKWMQENGLEWAHRLILEPRRMAKRYLLGNMKFIMHVIAEYRSERKGN